MYREFTKAIIRETGTLAILSNVKQARSDEVLEAPAIDRGIQPTLSLPSWALDYQENDCTEYIAVDEHIKRTSTEGQNRTYFPQPLVQQSYVETSG